MVLTYLGDHASGYRFRCLKLPVDKSFQYFSAELRKMEPTLGAVHALRQEAEELDCEDKYIPDYVRQQQALDREERTA